MHRPTAPGREPSGSRRLARGTKYDAVAAFKADLVDEGLEERLAGRQIAGPSTKGSRFAFWEAGDAELATSDFVRCSLPRRELPGRKVVTVRFTTAITHEGEWFVARALEVEVTSQGHSIDEALANLREALELYFEDEALPEDVEPPIIATVQLSA